MAVSRKILISLIFLFTSLHAVAEYPLPALGLSPRVTVSGTSSGAFMSVQLQVAYSSLISGVATFSGGIYGCAEGDFRKAKKCMEDPQTLDAKKFISLTQELVKTNSIDPLENLENVPVLVFSGNRDSVVRIEASFRLEEFFRLLKSKTELNVSVPAEHGFPTESYGNNCGEKGSPWLQKCGVDGAKLLFSRLLAKPLNPRGFASRANLQAFDQTPYRSANDGLAETGAIYIPTACRKVQNPECEVHIALHGCHMSPEFIQMEFLLNSGLNEWAETNNIVVLYPSTKKSETNPSGCWDWYGYTGKNYLTRESKQMKALVTMLRALHAPAEKIRKNVLRL